MDRAPNPIPFNPDTMTINQAKECVETLRTAFDQINRGVDPDTLFHSLDGAMAQMIRKYGAAA